METDKETAPFVQQLAVATDGSTTLFDVAAKPEDTANVNQKLQTVRTEYLPHVAHLEQVMGQGNKGEALRAEIAKGDYELVIIDNAQAQADDQLWQLLVGIGIPVLFTPRTFMPIQHLLICTAAGEPGKSDVRFGGRLARRLQASIKLLYISQNDFLPLETNRVTVHLEQAQELLSTLGVAATYEIKPDESPSAGILQMMETGAYELLVVGASVPPDPDQVILNTLDRYLVTHCLGPILVVPMLD
jgi:nucleotide-binding universal stress UspA family protein